MSIYTWETKTGHLRNNWTVYSKPTLTQKQYHIMASSHYNDMCNHTHSRPHLRDHESGRRMFTFQNDPLHSLWVKCNRPGTVLKHIKFHNLTTSLALHRRTEKTEPELSTFAIKNLLRFDLTIHRHSILKNKTPAEKLVFTANLNFDIMKSWRLLRLKSKMYMQTYILNIRKRDISRKEKGKHDSQKRHHTDMDLHLGDE